MEKRTSICYQEIIDKLASKKDFYKKRDFQYLRDILFKDFENYSGKSFKFDFSFPISKTKDFPLRFTFNNFGEEGKFRNKLKKIFDLFGNEINQIKARQLLSVIKKEPLTLGIEWLLEKKNPIFKIEFEVNELKSQVLIKKLCLIAGYNYNFLKYSYPEWACAVTATFYAREDIRLKLYFRFDKIEDINNFGFLKYSHRKELQGFFQNAPRRDIFYLLGLRLNKNGGVSSVKNYLVYENKEFQECFKPQERWSDLDRLNISLVSRKNIIYKILNICKRNRCILYPTVIGVDIPEDSKRKEIDLYFSIFSNKSYV